MIMSKEFPQDQMSDQISLHQLQDKEDYKHKLKHWRMMENPDLTLGLSGFIVATETNNINNSSSESELRSGRKRKFFCDHFKNDSIIQTSIELQLNDPLPLDWEQCLDLESGRMYYLNRKTLKRSYNWPKEQKIDLELNISTCPSSDEVSSNANEDSEEPKKKHSSNNMVAVACLKCHLLVMLSESSPCCPNCKYLHSLPTQQNPSSKGTSTKSLETLRLLN